MENVSTENDLHVEVEDFVATVEICRPPHNFLDHALIGRLADIFDLLDNEKACRAILLCSQGKSFCAGANFGDGSKMDEVGNVRGAPNSEEIAQLYRDAVRLFSVTKPVVGAVHGAAVGGGLGLALVPDFRVTCQEARFCANFTRLGFHPGFGLTATLPRLIGETKASLMFLTSRRLKGDEAYSIGLADVLVSQEDVRRAAWELAREIAANGPLAVVSTRATLRRGLVEKIELATQKELEEQDRLRPTRDFREGVVAMAERRIPQFQGR